MTGHFPELAADLAIKGVLYTKDGTFGTAIQVGTAHPEVRSLIAQAFLGRTVILGVHNDSIKIGRVLAIVRGPVTTRRPTESLVIAADGHPHRAALVNLTRVTRIEEEA